MDSRLPYFTGKQWQYCTNNRVINDLVRIDTAGNMLSKFHFADMIFDEITLYHDKYFIPTSDGFCLVDSTGNVALSKMVGTGSESIVVPIDSNQFLVFASYSGVGVYSVSKCDSAFNVLWTKETPFSSYLDDIVISNNYLYTCASNTISRADFDFNLTCSPLLAPIAITNNSHLLTPMTTTTNWNFLTVTSTPFSIGTINHNVFQIFCGPVGVEELNQTNNFEIIPNPSSSNFTVQLKNISSGKIEVYNAIDEKVYSSVFQLQQEIAINLKVKAGIYFLKITDAENKNIGWKKLVIE